jgi:hypothetical protein
MFFFNKRTVVDDTLTQEQLKLTIYLKVSKSQSLLSSLRLMALS